MSSKDFLLVPDAVDLDPNSSELLRAWVANKGLQVSLRVGVWDDPAAWGVVLSDLAKHVAISYEQHAGFVRSKALKRIRDVLEKELNSSADESSGRIISP